MTEADRDVLRTIIREEVRAAMDEHEANLAVARVRRSAALEELARNDAHNLSAEQMLMPTMLEEIRLLYPDPTTKHTIYEEVAGAPAGTFRIRAA